MMKNPDLYSTSDIPEEYEGNDETSQAEFLGEETIPHFISRFGTASSIPELEHEDSIEKIIETPLPSKPIEQIRGKTIAKWAIDRRRTARFLSDIWNKASERVNDAAFAVYVDKLVSEIDRKIPLFRDIPYEDTFSGILQLIHDALIGENFSRIQKENLENLIDEIFETLVSKEKLDLLEYQKIHRLFSEKQLLTKQF